MFTKKTFMHKKQHLYRGSHDGQLQRWQILNKANNSENIKY